MNYKELADFLFPDIKDVSYYEELYAPRKIKEDAKVTRFAPSPTGFVHMGSLYAAFLSSQMAHQSDGIFYLRIEDTDQKREVENGVVGILRDLESFNITLDEGYSISGEYGPYIQSERGDIYKAYVKDLISKGLAYPCFCSPEELDEIRKVQEASKERLGYYGRWTNCRSLTLDMVKEKVSQGILPVYRLKSQGDFTKRHVYNDAIKGPVEYLENDMDIVILKSDGLPTYHFAHAVDDHLMHTTHVTRGDEWLPSLPVHLELFTLLGFEIPQYAHIAPLQKKDEETGNIRKLSKRKDPEASVRYYHEMGIPVDAVKLYLATVGNTNFEEWYTENSDKTIDDFKFTFEKMPVGGTLFDLVKLESIAKIYFSRRKASEIYDETLIYSKEFDPEFAELLEKYPQYTIDLLNIERECERPRKDIGCYKDVKKEFWYMYDELFNEVENPYVFEKDYDVNDLKEYIENIYDEADPQDVWFDKIKVFASEHGYAVNRKEYKATPEAFKGQVADFCEIIRIMATTKTISPNLYDVLVLLGKDRIMARLDKFINAYNNR